MPIASPIRSDATPAFRRGARPAWLVGGLLGVVMSLGTVRSSAAPATGTAFDLTVRPLLGEYCLKCHSSAKHKGDLDLEQFTNLEAVKKHPKVWLRVIEQLENAEMPPKDQAQPAREQRQDLLSWANAVLEEVALERAGDPGPVVLRRLSNAEYTYTIRDLTGVTSLDPAREFPVDGASGEGFMNVGHSLVMSPTLITKYLDAAKEIASHAMLLPSGLRFSPKTTRRDWTEELLGEIRAFYRQFTDPRGGDTVNLQGIVFETNEGGRLPLEKYLQAALELRSGAKEPSAVAAAAGLSVKYLSTLNATLSGGEPSFLLDPIRARWRTAQAADVPALANEIAAWQKALWRFTSVGHIGKAGGPKAWMETVTPLATQQEVRLKLAPATNSTTISLYLVASDAGDGSDHDMVIWREPRFTAPGRPKLLLRDVREITRDLTERRARLFADTAKALTAAAEAAAAASFDPAALAQKHGLDVGILEAWLDYLGIGPAGQVTVTGYFTNTLNSASGYDFIKGWGSSDTPLLLANSSDQHVRVPGNMKPHSVAVHPSPTLAAVVGWRSPAPASVRVEAVVQHAHPECGNGVTWALELRRGATRQRLAAGTAQGAKEVKAPPIENLAVLAGDLVSLVIGPRDGNHSCDLTAVDLVLTTAGEPRREWNLAREVSPDVLAGNPHADRAGAEGVWHFYTEPDKGGGESGPMIPAGSLLAKWQGADTPEARGRLAEEVQRLLTSSAPPSDESPDAKLHRQLASLGGPLLSGAMLRKDGAPPRTESASSRPASADGDNEPGLDPARFGVLSDGSALDAGSLCVRAPSVIEVRLPADLVAGCEFVTTGVLAPNAGAEGSVQLQVLTTKPAAAPALLASAATAQAGKGTWTDGDRPPAYTTPIVVNNGSAARRRVEAAFDDFRQVFPAALCYTKIVPVDEVVTLTLFYREDQPLVRLMLDDQQKARLDRLWDELHFVSQDALTLVDAFEQLWQYATQDADPKVFEPLREPIKQRAAAFRQLLADTQPQHIQAVLDFAESAYRRPLTSPEKDELRELYRALRQQELPHDAAVRLTLARVLVAPAFLYRAEKPGPGLAATPVSDWDLANRLSYFLWSSAPDAELRSAAAQASLQNPEVLAAQARRMLRHPNVRRLATEFACAWLHIYDFAELGEKSERHFPAFIALRGPMYEESIRFFTDLFQRDGSVLELLDADHTFLNEALAKHYGIPGVTGDEWRRVDGVKQHSRGGVLGLATTLAKQSGASRTSPILRGNWVTEVLLGEKVPRPPKEVPRLPEDETATEGLTVRQLVEKHSSDPKCAGCHQRMDPYGYALEGFDAIGRRRDRDLGDRPIDTHARTMDGAEFDGLAGLRAYLLTEKRDAFLRQFCRKLLGYALGRAVELSDGPLLAEMRAQLKAGDYHVARAVDLIVRSRQFREIRGREVAYED